MTTELTQGSTPCKCCEASWFVSDTQRVILDAMRLKSDPRGATCLRGTMIGDLSQKPDNAGVDTVRELLC